MGAQNTRKGPWRALRRRRKPTPSFEAFRFYIRATHMGALPYKRKQPWDCDEVTIKGKLVPREVKTKWMNRHFMTQETLRGIHETLHAEGPGRTVSGGEARVEDLLTAESSGEVGQPNEE